MTKFNVESQILPEYSLSEYRDWYNQKVKIDPTSDLSYFISLFDWYWMGNTYISLPEKIGMLKKTHKLYKDVFENGQLKRLQPLFKLMIQLSKKELGPQFEVVNNKAEFDQQFIEQHVFFDDCFFEQKSFNIEYFDEFNKFISGSLDKLKLYIYSQKLIRSTIIEFGKYVNEYIIITDPYIPQNKCNLICPLCDTRTQIQISDLIYHMEHPETSLNISKHNNCECVQFFKVCVYGQSQQVFGLSMLGLEEFEKKQASVFNKKEPITGGVNVVRDPNQPAGHEVRPNRRPQQNINIQNNNNQQDEQQNIQRIQQYRQEVQQIMINANDRLHEHDMNPQKLSTIYQEVFNKLETVYNKTMDVFEVAKQQGWVINDNGRDLQQLIHDIQATVFGAFVRYSTDFEIEIDVYNPDILQQRLEKQYNDVLITVQELFKSFLNYDNIDNDLKDMIKHLIPKIKENHQLRAFRKMLQNVKLDNGVNTLSLLQKIQRDNIKQQPNPFFPDLQLILPINLQNPYDSSNTQLQGVQDGQKYLNDQRWLYFSAVSVYWEDTIDYYRTSISEYIILNFGKLLNEIISDIVDKINLSTGDEYTNYKDEQGRVFPKYTINIPLTIQDINNRRREDYTCKIGDDIIKIDGTQIKTVELAQDYRIANYILQITMKSHIQEDPRIEHDMQEYIEMKIADLKLITNDNDQKDVSKEIVILERNNTRGENTPIQLYSLLYTHLHGHIYFVMKKYTDYANIQRYYVKSIYTIHGMLQYNILQWPQDLLYIFPTKRKLYLRNNICFDNNTKIISIYIKYLLLVQHTYKQLQQYNDDKQNPIWLQFKKIMGLMQISVSSINMNKIFIDISQRLQRQQDFQRFENILTDLTKLELRDIQQYRVLYNLIYNLLLCCFTESISLQQYCNNWIEQMNQHRQPQYQFDERCFIKLRNSIQLIVKKIIIDVIHCGELRQMVMFDDGTQPCMYEYIHEQIQQEDNYFNNDIFAGVNGWLHYCLTNPININYFKNIIAYIIEQFDNDLTNVMIIDRL